MEWFITCCQTPKKHTPRLVCDVRWRAGLSAATGYLSPGQGRAVTPTAFSGEAAGGIEDTTERPSAGHRQDKGNTICLCLAQYHTRLRLRRLHDRETRKLPSSPVNRKICILATSGAHRKLSV